MWVEVTDVYLRDGLQDEHVLVPASAKLRVFDALSAAGVPRVEAGSFVNPSRVPQMADAEEVFAGIAARGPGPRVTALALNARGIRRAVESGVREIQVAASASNAHSAANAGGSTERMLADLAAEIAQHPEVDFHAAVSMAFTCTFEGRTPPEALLAVVRSFAGMGLRSISLADTPGTASTQEVLVSLDHVRRHEPDLDYALHLHDGLGQALDTVTAALTAGVSRFDAALAGFGGCPFAPGAAGNLASERLVEHLHSAGHRTGIDEALLREAAALARDVVAGSPPLPGRENENPVRSG